MLCLFDIDGTLIGGDGAGRRAFELACVDCMKLERALDHMRLDGMTDPLILEGIFRHHHDRVPTALEIETILASYLAHLEGQVASGLYHVKPAVPETLDHLERRGATIGLATGNLEAGARIKLKRGDLWRRFPFGGFGSDAADRGEMVGVAIARGERHAGRRFAGEEIFVIGDTPKDIAAAHANGARAVAVATGSFSVAQLEEAGADSAWPTLAEWLATL